MDPNRRYRRYLDSLWITAALLVAGCASPLDQPDHDLSRIVRSAVDAELIEARQSPGAGDQQSLIATTGDVAQALASRRDELDQLTPSMAAPTAADLGRDLFDQPQANAAIDYDTAVRSALRRNLALRRAILAPSIDAAALVNAQSVFDVVLFSSANLTKTDEPVPVPVLGMTQLGSPISASDAYRFETGIRKQNRYGGEGTLKTTLTRTQSNGALTLSPDPAYAAALQLGYTQPLLRGFGRVTNTAAIRLAENAEQSSVEALRGEMLSLIEQVDGAYWSLLVAWHELEIRQWLIVEGERIRDRLAGRRELDALQSQYADAVARVEQRKGDVLRAQRAVRAASDNLKALLDDPDLSVTSEVVLRPAEGFREAAIEWNLAEAMRTAVAQRPEIRQALLSADDAAIRAQVAENGLLPILNLSGNVVWTGLDDRTDDAYANASDAEFIDYIVSLTYEVPIGNRGPDAQHLQARLQRAQALLAYRETVRNVVLGVKGALRDVVTNHQLIDQARSFRIAQAENWRTTLVDEETRGRLTPEFLNLQFQRQETLATARLQELAAQADYERSLAALWRAMGTGLDRAGIDIERLPDDSDGRELLLDAAHP